jgi:Ras GTPase-activating-like protein IQGAP2/3
LFYSLQNTYTLYTVFQLVAEELLHLGSLASSIETEIKSLSKVLKTVQEHNTYLKAQLLSYKSYLQNVRVQTMPGQKMKKESQTSERNGTGAGSSLGGNATLSKQSTSEYRSLLKLPYAKLENDRVIVESNIPPHRRANIFFKISAPLPGTFLIELHYSGREQAILELELTLDDLLEKQQMGVTMLDLEYVKMDVTKTLQLLNQSFVKGTLKRK